MPRRKIPAHLPTIEFHNRSPIVFVTVCATKRQPLFARSDAVELIVRCWREASRWAVGRYVILPDHIHFFCAPNASETFCLRNWVKYWKTLVSRQWPRPDEQPIWQTDFWDRQLRTGDSYSDKWEYVRLNPVRHGLVAKPDDWPYQGELNVLEWHDP